MCLLQVNPLFGTIYNSIYLLAKSIHNARRAGMRLSGSNLAYFTKNSTFSGFNQRVWVDTGGDVKTNYVVLDTDNRGSQLYQTYLVDVTAGVLRFAGRSIHFPGGSPPPSDSSCWFEKNAICKGGERHVGVWVDGRVHSVFSYTFCHSFIIPHFPQHQVYLLSSSGVEVTYIIVVLAVIFILAVGGLAISLYIRYSLETQTNSSFPPSNSSRLFFHQTRCVRIFDDVMCAVMGGLCYGLEMRKEDLRKIVERES